MAETTGNLSRDFFLTGCIYLSSSLSAFLFRRQGDTKTGMPALQQKLSPSRKAGQRPIHKDKTSFCRFQPKDSHRKIRHYQQTIIYISTSSCCDLSSPALFPSHSASIVCPFSVSVILLYPSYQICVICWSFCLA